MCNKQNIIDDFYGEITNLADVIIEKSIGIIVKKTLEKCKLKVIPEDFGVFALGNGAKEMGYASDIEILLVYNDENKSFKRKTRN